VLAWPKPRSLHGLAFVTPLPAYYAVDMWTGGTVADAKAALADDAHWREVGTSEPQMHGPRPQQATLRTVDFGATVITAAVRVRAVKPAGTRGYMGGQGPVTGPHTAGMRAIVALESLGDDLPDLPIDRAQRVTEIVIDEAGHGTVARHIVVPHPGNLAFDAAGTLHAVSGDRIVTIDLDKGAVAREVVPAGVVAAPTAIAFAPDGSLLVGDAATHAIAVIDPKTGKRTRAIGAPGGRSTGPFDEDRFENPAGIAFDSAGKLWVCEDADQPKRVSRWTSAGAHERSFFGPSFYGGGGYLDQGDHRILRYHGMEFIIDWATGASRLTDILYRPGAPESLRTAMPDRAVYVDGRRYLVGDPAGSVAVVCVARDHRAIPVAAAGNLADWGDVDADPALRAAFGKMNRGTLGFCWCDANGDGRAQPDEVAVTKEDRFRPTNQLWSSRIGDDLSINFAGVRLAATFTKDGMPRYDVKRLQRTKCNAPSWTTADGRIFSVEAAMYAKDGGDALWRYTDEYSSVHGSHRIGYDRPAGTLVGSLGTVGHFKIAGEELFIQNGNHGDWFAFTADGLLAACVFGGPGNIGKRQWSMPEAIPNKTDLSDLGLGEEHFFGSICLAEDGNVYAVAGHNHASVVRVDGLERMKRLPGGEVTVTPADHLRVQEQQDRLLAKARPAQPQSARVHVVPTALQIDGTLHEWNPEDFTIVATERDPKGEIKTVAAVALACDRDRLYVAANVSDASPMTNNAEDPVAFFKGGDAVDVCLGLDPQADPKRTKPVDGDIRLVLGLRRGKPLVMLYRPVAPGAPADQRRTFTSFHSTSMDQVVAVAEAELEMHKTNDGWELEASVPWKALGHEAPEAGDSLSGDVGVLASDEHGVGTVNRRYWSGKGQTIVSDLPSEARLSPMVWGTFQVVASEGEVIESLDLDDVKTR
ncbi:MAG: hypothetical protein H0W72_07700, partial [Planctomycetes bacterium]|nr:hypothetical protein [Planctomycetota bacterium]